MKLLLINYEYPPIGGGSATATYYLTRELVKLGCEILIVTTFYPGLKIYEENSGHKIIRVKSLRKRKDRSNPLEMLLFIFKTIEISRSIIEQFKPEKTLAFFTIPSGIIALYLKLRYKIPYIISLRGGDVPGFQNKELWFYHLLAYPLILIIWSLANYVIANSQGLKKIAAPTAKLIKKTIIIIPNAIDINKFKPKTSKPVNKINKIMSVSRLTKQKNIGLLINALNLFKSNYQLKFKAEIVGNGPDMNRLIKLRNDLCLKKEVIFSGWIDRKYLVKKYQTADLFISTSSYEGMSNSILEAIACGLPVLISDIDSNKDIIRSEKNDFFFRHDDINNLTQKIKLILSNKDYASCLSKESIKTAKFYNWGNTAKQYYRLLLI